MLDFVRVLYLCDLYHCREELLTVEGVFKRLLRELALEIGMEAVSEPLICRIASERTPYAGYSGSLIIKQSHINFHGWTHERRVEISIDSCQPFDAGRATAFVSRFFGASACETTYTVQERSILDAPAPILDEQG